MATNLAIVDHLLEEAEKLGKHHTKKETVNAALPEYIQRRKQQRIVGLFDCIEYDANCDYKNQQRRKRAGTSWSTLRFGLLHYGGGRRT